MRARAAGLAEGAGCQASSRRERSGGSVMGRILGPFGDDGTDSYGLDGQWVITQ
jgi:hypothetical protein